MKLRAIRVGGLVARRGARRWLKRPRVATGTLVLWFLAAAAVSVFALLATNVAGGETQALDERLLLLLRDPADPLNAVGPGWFEEMMRDFTALGGLGVITILTVAVAGFLYLQGNYR